MAREEKEEEEAEDEVTTVAPSSTSTVFTAFGSSSSSSSSALSPTSSVAEELFGDEESINNEVEPETKAFSSSGPRNILSGFRKPRKWPSVKKAKVGPC